MHKLEFVNLFYDDNYDTVMMVPGAACKLGKREVVLDNTILVDHLWVSFDEVQKYLVWPNQLACVREIRERLEGSQPFSKFHELRIDEEMPS